jgi:hypothetical protein
MKEIVDIEYLTTDNYKPIPGFEILMPAGVYNFIFIDRDMYIYIYIYHI